MKKKATLGAAFLTAATLNAAQSPKNVNSDLAKPKIEITVEEESSDSLASVLSFEKERERLQEKNEIKAKVKESIKANEDIKKLVEYYGEDVMEGFINSILDKIIQNLDQYMTFDYNQNCIFNEHEINNLIQRSLEGFRHNDSYGSLVSAMLFCIIGILTSIYFTNRKREKQLKGKQIQKDSQVKFLLRKHICNNEEIKELSNTVGEHEIQSLTDSIIRRIAYNPKYITFSYGGKCILNKNEIDILIKDTLKNVGSNQFGKI